MLWRDRNHLTSILFGVRRQIMKEVSANDSTSQWSCPEAAFSLELYSAECLLLLTSVQHFQPCSFPVFPTRAGSLGNDHSFSHPLPISHLLSAYSTSRRWVYPLPFLWHTKQSEGVGLNLRPRSTPTHTIYENPKKKVRDHCKVCATARHPTTLHSFTSSKCDCFGVRLMTYKSRAAINNVFSHFIPFRAMPMYHDSCWLPSLKDGTMYSNLFNSEQRASLGFCFCFAVLRDESYVTRWRAI